MSVDVRIDGWLMEIGRHFAVAVAVVVLVFVFVLMVVSVFTACIFPLAAGKLLISKACIQTCQLIDL